MSETVLARLFEHNHWANIQIVRACAGLTDAQLDAPPKSATEGSIRSTLLHLASAQYGYLRLLTLPLEERRDSVVVPFEDIEKSLKDSGERLLELARDPGKLPSNRIQTRNNRLVQPWVVMVQIVNHATEHREQIKSMLTALGMTPPSIDGWDYGTSVNALAPVEE